MSYEGTPRNNLSTAKARLGEVAGKLFYLACDEIDSLIDISDNAGINLQQAFVDAMFKALYPQEWREQERKRRKREKEKGAKNDK